MRFEVLLYETKNGDCPVEMFLNGLDAKMRAKVTRMIKVLEEKGNEVREPFSKHLTDGIFELRAQLGSNISRGVVFLCCWQ